MDLLILLVERRGQLVTRAEIVDALWGKDVFVDVETGVHTAIRKIRQALRDAPEAPTFIETVPGKGYRFVAPVEALAPEAVPPAAAPAGGPPPQAAQELPPACRRHGPERAASRVGAIGRCGCQPPRGPGCPGKFRRLARGPSRRRRRA